MTLMLPTQEFPPWQVYNSAIENIKFKVETKVSTHCHLERIQLQ